MDDVYIEVMIVSIFAWLGLEFGTSLSQRVFS